MATEQAEEKEVPTTPEEPKPEEAKAEAPPPEEKKEETKPPEEPKTEARKVKLKVNGKEVEVEESEALSWAQQGLAAQQRFQEAARARKAAETIFDGLKKDPKGTYLKIFTAQAGGDEKRGKELFHDFLVANINEFILEQQLPPEERERKERQSELERREAQLKAKEEEISKAEVNALAAQHQAAIQAELPAALKSVGLPETPEVQSEVIEEALRAADADVELTLEQAARRVKLNRIAAGRDLIGILSPAEIKAQYPDQWEKIIKFYTDEIRKGTSNPKSPTKPADGDKGRTGHKVPPKSLAEWNARIMDRCGDRTID